MEKIHEKSQTSKKKSDKPVLKWDNNTKKSQKKTQKCEKKHRLVIMYLNLRVYLFLSLL